MADCTVKCYKKGRPGNETFYADCKVNGVVTKLGPFDGEVERGNEVTRWRISNCSSQDTTPCQNE